MTKAILKKVTIPQAFEIQGNFSSSVQKYIFKSLKQHIPSHTQ